MLEAWLEYHRATLALKCEGLTDRPAADAVGPAVDAVAARPRAPHGRGRAQLVPLLARRATEPITRWTKATRTSTVDDADVDEAFDYWRAECENAREVRRAVRLARRRRRGPDGRRRDLAALDARPHDRGVRPPQRPRRPPPRTHRRHHRRLTADRRALERTCRATPVAGLDAGALAEAAGEAPGAALHAGALGGTAGRLDPHADLLERRRGCGAAAARSASITDSAATIAATCSGDGLPPTTSARITAACCRACAPASARASCAASRARGRACAACRAGRSRRRRSRARPLGTG